MFSHGLLQVQLILILSVKGGVRIIVLKRKHTYIFETFGLFPNIKNGHLSHNFERLLASYLLPPWPPEKGGNSNSDLQEGISFGSVAPSPIISLAHSHCPFSCH